MNGVTEVEFTEPKSRVPRIYKILFAAQAVSLLIVYVAAKGWLN
jgi:hypothetical protein